MTRRKIQPFISRHWHRFKDLLARSGTSPLMRNLSVMWFGAGFLCGLATATIAFALDR